MITLHVRDKPFFEGQCMIQGTPHRVPINMRSDHQAKQNAHRHKHIHSC